jgi:hypothetical protein
MSQRDTVERIIGRLHGEYSRVAGVGAIKARVEGLHGAALRQALKTVGYWDRALNRAVLDFYNGDIDASEFIDEMVRLIEEQFTRAWNEGARDVGYGPEDYTEDDKAELQDHIDKELEFVLDYAEGIESAKLNGDPVKPYQERIVLWTNRYNEMVNEGRIWFGKNQRLVWRLGKTEQHCSTCATLNGIVATARQWEESGYHPQGAPNDKLECGGWRCDCSLELTREPLTEGGIPDA